MSFPSVASGSNIFCIAFVRLKSPACFVASKCSRTRKYSYEIIRTIAINVCVHAAIYLSINIKTFCCDIEYVLVIT